MSRAKRNAAAEDYLRRAPNYSAEAIQSFRAWRDTDYPETEELLAWFSDRIEASHKFALPFGGRLFDRPPSNDDVGEWRPPFPETVFEFDAMAAEDAESGMPRCVLPCIALVSEGPGMTHVYAASRQPEGWSPCAFWAGFARSNKDSSDGGAPFEVDVAGPTGIKIGVLPGLASSVAETMGITGANVVEKGGRYLAVHLTAAIQACAALACTNLTTVVIRPNREARAARPASTLFDYHVLMIDPGKAREPGEDHGGSHASPRTHLRRGHIRRLAWGPRIWVNSCVVNPSAIGTVNKDYAIRGPR